MPRNILNKARFTEHCWGVSNITVDEPTAHHQQTISFPGNIAKKEAKKLAHFLRK
jgi:hypothetical protein